jgi:hypothetical protein
VFGAVDRYKQGHVNGSRSAGDFLWQAQKVARANAGCLASETLQFAHGAFLLRLGEAVYSFSQPAPSETNGGGRDRGVSYASSKGQSPARGTRTLTRSSLRVDS